ncbi:methyl-accepting chemotaxis protein [Paraburkholderia sp. CNPSo 3272]|uniref:methyl-accepting chemotaxis protein n=1 Tax=Paraburkholderia sp. CNPSo 3272 TaxID=2940931 RepID=UPI0035CD1FC2
MGAWRRGAVPAGHSGAYAEARAGWRTAGRKLRVHDTSGSILLAASGVANGATLAQHAGSTMLEVTAAVQRVTDIMGEIVAASGEQSTGIEQVNRAVAQMDQVTQQNAALVEQAAAAASSMADQAAQLQQAVSVFRFAGA